jgi:hypothetical protein
LAPPQYFLGSLEYDAINHEENYIFGSGDVSRKKAKMKAKMGAAQIK